MRRRWSAGCSRSSPTLQAASRWWLMMGAGRDPRGRPAVFRARNPRAARLLGHHAVGGRGRAAAPADRGMGGGPAAGGDRAGRPPRPGAVRRRVLRHRAHGRRVPARRDAGPPAAVLTGLLDRSALFGVLAEIEALGLDLLEIQTHPRPHITGTRPPPLTLTALPSGAPGPLREGAAPMSSTPGARPAGRPSPRATRAALLSSLLLALSARRLRGGPNMGAWPITQSAGTPRSPQVKCGRGERGGRCPSGIPGRDSAVAEDEIGRSRHARARRSRCGYGCAGGAGRALQC